MSLEAGVVLLLAGNAVEAGGWRQQPGGRSERLMYCELRGDVDEVDAVVAVAEELIKSEKLVPLSMLAERRV